MKKRVITLVAMAILVLGLVACNKEGSEPVSALNYQYIFMNAEVGDIVSFGHYEQDNDLSNGAEEIEWHVLSAEITPNGLYKELYIISEYVLDCQQYNEEYVSRVVLTSSDLYKWLKDTFFNTAFTTEEQAYPVNDYMDIRKRIVSEWLPANSYEIKDAPEISVYHWFPKYAKEKRYIEIWLPIEKTR